MIDSDLAKQPNNPTTIIDWYIEGCDITFFQLGPSHFILAEREPQKKAEDL